MVSRLRTNLLGLAMVALPCAGCCQHSYQPKIHTAGYAIFNPGASPVMVADNSRADWPAVYAGDVVSEDLAYHEKIVDIQGRGWDHHDGFLYRRFESDRYGRGRR